MLIPGIDVRLVLLKEANIGLVGVLRFFRRIGVRKEVVLAIVIAVSMG